MNPFSRQQRALVYSRAKGNSDSLPFGTRRNLYTMETEAILHTMKPVEVAKEHQRVAFGLATGCAKPYSASLLNVSAMSFGAISRNAILALNEAAAQGEFASNTGEGGVSPYHLERGGDLIWNIGTGYFGARNDDGSFSLDKFTAMATTESIKMIEIKLSQGAKPGQTVQLPIVCASNIN